MTVMAKKKIRKVPVSERALAQRINRKLAHEGQLLKVYKGTRYENDLGRYYIVGLQTNVVEATHCDLEKIGREMRCLADFEELAE
jgi:hypothetical protein